MMFVRNRYLYLNYLIGAFVDSNSYKSYFPVYFMAVKKKLYRAAKRDSVLGGVATGIAEYVNADPTVIRLLWVLAALLWGGGILAYIIAWIIIPRKK